MAGNLNTCINTTMTSSEEDVVDLVCVTTVFDRLVHKLSSCLSFRVPGIAWCHVVLQETVVAVGPKIVFWVMMLFKWLL
jgi:hypothetical protein